jgi:cytoskeletal protein CcmA (bactofilin family)
MAASALPAAEPAEADIIVDFDYEGDVTAGSSIIVSEGCVLRGGAFAPLVRVAGQIVGEVHADRFEVLAEGSASGDMRVGLAKVMGHVQGLLVAGRRLVCGGARIDGQVVADEAGMELGVELLAVLQVRPGASADNEMIEGARRVLARPRARAAAETVPVAPAPVPVAAPVAARAPVPVAVAAPRQAPSVASAAPAPVAAPVRPVPVPEASRPPEPLRVRPAAPRPAARPAASAPLQAPPRGGLPMPSLID